MFEKGNMVQAQNFHHFIDASQDAYATVMFGRNQCKNGIISFSLVALKSKVAP